MYIDSIELKNFRNINNLSLNFSDGINAFIGKNGSGKTNIVESIYLCGITKSFRNVQDEDLVNHDENTYYIKCLFYKESEAVPDIIEIGYEKRGSVYRRSKKIIKQNEKIQKRASDLIGELKIFVFHNPDIELIVGPPQIRRDFFNQSLSVMNKKYLQILQKYNKVVKLRNIELKNFRDNKSNNKTLFKIYDDQLIEYGSKLIEIRNVFFNEISYNNKLMFDKLGNEFVNFDISYVCSLSKNMNYTNVKDIFHQKLIDNEQKEIILGQTLYGPHKDDFSITSSNLDYKKYSSQGQNRFCGLVLKLSVTEYVKKVTQHKPVVIFDDVLNDLDEKKKIKFLENMQDYQVFITSTSIEYIDRIYNNQQNYRVFNVENGKII